MFTPLKLPTYTKYAGRNENCVYSDTSVLPSHLEIDKGHLWYVCLCEQMSYLDTGVHHFAAQNIFNLSIKTLPFQESNINGSNSTNRKNSA